MFGKEEIDRKIKDLQTQIDVLRNGIYSETGRCISTYSTGQTHGVVMEAARKVNLLMEHFGLVVVDEPPKSYLKKSESEK